MANKSNVNALADLATKAAAFATQLPGRYYLYYKPSDPMEIEGFEITGFKYKALKLSHLHIQFSDLLRRLHEISGDEHSTH